MHITIREGTTASHETLMNNYVNKQLLTRFPIEKGSVSGSLFSLVQ